MAISTYTRHNEARRWQAVVHLLRVCGDACACVHLVCDRHGALIAASVFSRRVSGVLSASIVRRPLHTAAAASGVCSVWCARSRLAALLRGFLPTLKKVRILIIRTNMEKKKHTRAGVRGGRCGGGILAARAPLGVVAVVVGAVSATVDVEGSATNA